MAMVFSAPSAAAAAASAPGNAPAPEVPAGAAAADEGSRAVPVGAFTPVAGCCCCCRPRRAEADALTSPELLPVVGSPYATASSRPKARASAGDSKLVLAGTKRSSSALPSGRCCSPAFIHPPVDAPGPLAIFPRAGRPGNATSSTGYVLSAAPVPALLGPEQAPSPCSTAHTVRKGVACQAGPHSAAAGRRHTWHRHVQKGPTYQCADGAIALASRITRRAPCTSTACGVRAGRTLRLGCLRRRFVSGAAFDPP